MSIPALPPKLIPPTDEDVRLAQASSRALSRYLQAGEPGTARLVIDQEIEPVVVPMAALRVFLEVLTQMGLGNAVTVIPVKAELTTQEAADLLNVSRPYLVSLLETGQIPFRKVGARRRVRYHDILAYKERIDREREKALDALATQAQELDMGY